MFDFTTRSVHPTKYVSALNALKWIKNVTFACMPSVFHKKSMRMNCHVTSRHVTSSVRSHFRTGHNSVTTNWTMPVTLIEAFFLQLAKVEAFSFIGTVIFVIVVLGRRGNLPMFGVAWPFTRACRYLHVGCNGCRTSWRCGDRYRAYRWGYLSVLPYDFLVKLVSPGTFSVALNVLVQILLF